MENLIRKIAKEFNKSNITWGIGGAYLLKRYGINTELNDIDILISEDSIEKVEEVMNRISVKQEIINDEHFHSAFYTVYEMDGVNVNIVSNLSSDFDEEFNYVFDQEDISVYEVQDNNRINYCHLMDWYIIYKEINRPSMSSSIETYYKDGGFIDNSRFNNKFGRINLDLLHKNFNKLKTLIY